MNSKESISLADAARLIPNRSSPNTVWRWCRRGLKLRNGERIRLSYTQVGGRIFTTPADVVEFLERVTVADAEFFGQEARPDTPDGTL